jgi:tetratricopeptide (TPR) repeat protein
MEAAEEVAVAIGDRQRLGRALSLLCPSLRVTGEVRRSAETGRRALAIAAEVSDQDLEADASFWLGQTYTALGDYRAAEEFYQRTITPLPLDLTTEAARALPHFASNARAWLASSLAQLGRFDEGAALGAEALRLARAVDDKFRLIIAHHFLAQLHLYRGAFTDSVVHFESALSIGRLFDIHDFGPNNTAGLAVAYARLGRIEDARERAGPSPSSLTHLLWGAEVCLLTGRREEAREAGEQRLSSLRQSGERGLEGWILHLLGEIAAHGAPRRSGRPKPATMKPSR